MLLKVLITILILLIQVPLQTNIFLIQKFFYEFPDIEDLRTDPTEIFLFGDVMLGRYIATLAERYSEEDPTFPLTHFPEIVSAYSEDPEVVAVNLEGPISDFQISYCELCFRFLPETAPLLAQQGVNFVNLANNHIFNQGTDGYEQTKQYVVDAGINYVGHAREVNEYSSFIQEVDGIKVGWLGFDDIDGSLDYEAATQLTQEIAQEADFTIVAIHCGAEYVNSPSLTIQEHAHAFIDAGADTIWGTHPHVIQSIENYGNGMIFYSLGNLVFDQYWSTGTQQGLGVMIQLDDPEDPVYTLIPIKLTDGKGDPYLMDETNAQTMLSNLQQYSELIGVVADDNMNFEEATLKPW